jgi:poly [ADP-ribose] polymerase
MSDITTFEKLRFIKVEPGENNNKYYNMVKNKDGTFTSENGRIGAVKPQFTTYPMSRWEEKYKEKIKKGYMDVISFIIIIKTVGNVKIHDDKEVEELILALQKFANVNIANTYSDFANITKKQIEIAQHHVNNLAGSFKSYFGKPSWNINTFNTELTKLYSTIPRKMKKVADHLINLTTAKHDIEKMISDEQDNLDSLTSQMSANVVAEDNDVNDNASLLESMGLEISATITQKEIKMLEKLMSDSSHHFKKAYKVENKKTQKQFDDWLSNQKNKKTELFWHGSRNQNWWFIIQKGLLIRPSGAVTTGSMYGSEGIYFANKARKSIGYTSLSGSRWASGNSNKAYLAIFETHVGNQKHIHHHNSSCYSLNYNTIQKEGYDSVYAHKGADLINDEFIVYNVNQSTIKYLIEIS